MDAIRRTSIGFALLAALWIAVYWWWEPAPRSIVAEPPSPQRETPSPGPATLPVREPTPRPVEQPPPTRPQPERSATPPAPKQEPAETGVVSGVIAPEFREYTIRPGDTFATIALRQFGTIEHRDAIARANPLLDPRRLRPGQVIRVPVDPTNIQGKEVRSVPREEAAVKAVEYEIKPGDTLSAISKRFYGTTTHAEYLLEFNRDRIRDARSIRPGQVILVPTVPPGSAD